MGAGLPETLLWQFQLTWKLAEMHLPLLTDEACLWQPAGVCWTVRRNKAGRWRPDWNAKEPDPAPAVSIAWVTWHIIWWWSGLQAAMHGGTAPHHEAVDWPGSAAATRERLEQLAADWTHMLGQLKDVDLDRPVVFLATEARPAKLLLAWCNAELMKNIAEISTVHHLYELSRRSTEP